MSADVELPPARLVIKHDRGPISETEPFWNKRDVSDYARARVAHATATLNAEIEALRAEAVRTEAELHQQAELAEARAERLAEALREAADMLLADYPETAKRLRAALHPTAAQENDDA